MRRLVNHTAVFIVVACIAGCYSAKSPAEIRAATDEQLDTAIEELHLMRPASLKPFSSVGQYKASLVYHAGTRWGWKDWERAYVCEGKVEEGMTERMVVWSIGRPSRIDQLREAGASCSIFWYEYRDEHGKNLDATLAVYFRDHVCTHWQTYEVR